MRVTIGRRELLAALGGAAAAWPLAARGSLVEAYGEKEARARDVAEGFIHELAKRVAGDQNLDFEGMKQAVRNAIDIYEREIAGGQTQTVARGRVIAGSAVEITGSQPGGGRACSARFRLINQGFVGRQASGQSRPRTTASPC